MSSDLLAEFDSFYRAPQNDVPSHALTSTTSRPASALKDPTFFGAANSGSHKSSIPTSQPSDDIWGSLDGIDTGNTRNSTASSISNHWRNPEPSMSPVSARYQESGSQKAGHVRNVQDIYKAEPRNTRAGIVRRPTIDLFSSKIADLAESAATVEQNRASPWNSPAKATFQCTNTNILPKGTNDVLFDAADELKEEGDDDEFGDFETVSSPTPQINLLQIASPIAAEKSAKRPSGLSIIDESLAVSPFPYPQAPKSPSFQERNPFSELALATSSISNTKAEDALKVKSPVTAWPAYEPKILDQVPYHDLPPANDLEDEDWGDFADLPPESNDSRPSKSGIEADAWAWDAVDSQPAPVLTSPTGVLPPTNVPPPSVLLAIFPQLFNLPQSSLFQAVSNQPFTLKNRILSDPSTIDFLRAYILLATVAARIIAGRKLRWKRDTNLSQAMKIGPAVAHGKGGMKLVGVDKAEVVREDREAADLTRSWREQVGRLRSVVATANSSLQNHSAQLPVPEISDIMTIKIEGVLTAPKACFLCGLKREERVFKVDFQVEDSFGEWWVEHWGHRTCRNFWQEHEKQLKQR